jgi:hypothetical protein
MTIEAAVAQPQVARRLPPRPKAAGQVTSKPERPPRGRRHREKPPLLTSAIFVAIACFLLGLGNLALSALAGLGTIAVTMEEGLPSSMAGDAVVWIGVQALLSVCLIASGVGLLLRQPWGWWGATLMFAALVVFSLKMMTPILHINWDHPDALWAAFGVFLGAGLPIPVAAPMLVLLFRSPMRLAYGVKQSGYERHRASGRLRETARG